VDLIAAEAGVTKKTIYDRFGSKEQIVVEYLADRDERWRAFLDGYLDAAAPDPGGPDSGAPEPVRRVLAVFDASRDWMGSNSPRGCSMVNAHAEISDPAHRAFPIITGQKQWMLDLFTGLAREIEAASAEEMGQTLMLLHEGALVAHGLKMFPDPIGRAREQALSLLLGKVADRD
jgi:AcrR family transcriptional regulator